MDLHVEQQQYNPYRIFSREQWAKLRDDTTMPLAAEEIVALRSMHDRLDMREVEDIYLPLSRLLSIYVDATDRLYRAQRQFLGLRDDTPMTLEPGEFERLRSMHDRLDMREVEDIMHRA